MAKADAGLAAHGQPCPWHTVVTDDGQGGLRPPYEIAADAWVRLAGRAP